MNGQKQKSDWYIAYGIYGVVGIQLAASVLAGLFLGNYIDKKIGTLPWLTVVGLLLGTAGGFYNLIKILNWNRERK